MLSGNQPDTVGCETACTRCEYDAVMWREAADLELLMDRLAEAGVAMMLRVDVERFDEGKPHWTVLLSGPTLHPDHVIRVDSRDLGTGISTGLQRLREHDGDWAWLDDWV